MKDRWRLTNDGWRGYDRCYSRYLKGCLKGNDKNCRLFDYKTRYKSVKERNIRKWLLKNIDDEKKTLITRFAYETSIDEFYESEKKKKNESIHANDSSLSARLITQLSLRENLIGVASCFGCTCTSLRILKHHCVTVASAFNWNRDS